MHGTQVLNRHFDMMAREDPGLALRRTHGARPLGYGDHHGIDFQGCTRFAVQPVGRREKLQTVWRRKAVNGSVAQSRAGR